MGERKKRPDDYIKLVDLLLCFRACAAKNAFQLFDCRLKFVAVGGYGDFCGVFLVAARSRKPLERTGVNAFDYAVPVAREQVGLNRREYAEVVLDYGAQFFTELFVVLLFEHKQRAFGKGHAVTDRRMSRVGDYFSPDRVQHVVGAVFGEHVFKPLLGEGLGIEKIADSEHCFAQVGVSLFARKSVEQLFEIVRVLVVEILDCRVHCFRLQQFKLGLLGGAEVGRDFKRVKVFADYIRAKAVYC